jgi:hypothetical protein
MLAKDILSSRSAKAQQPNGPLAFSYTLFARAENLQNDDQRRCVQATADYCAKTGLRLLPASHIDLGIAVLDNKSMDGGALSAFLQATEQGNVAKGSYLVIERFETLTRSEANNALQLLLYLVRLDITVVTLADQRVWTSETVQDVAEVLTSLVLLHDRNSEIKA